MCPVTYAITITTKPCLIPASGAWGTDLSDPAGRYSVQTCTAAAVGIQPSANMPSIIVNNERKFLIESGADGMTKYNTDYAIED